jgi:hypothetical protein
MLLSIIQQWSWLHNAGTDFRVTINPDDVEQA